MLFQRYVSKAFWAKSMPQILYVVLIPFYMLEITYMLSLGGGRNQTNQWLIAPLLWGTIWIPAFLGVLFNQLYKRYKQGNIQRKWDRNYPIIFISSYSVYFFLLSCLSFGKHYLTAAFSSAILIFFLFLLKNAQKEMFYLPPPKEFWFYFLTFIPPIAVLFSTDVYFLIMKESPYFILLAPVSYLPEIFGFWVYCRLRRLFFSKKKRGKLTLFQSIFVMQVMNVSTSFYFGSFWGDRVIWISLTFSFASLLVAQKFSKYR